MLNSDDDDDCDELNVNNNSSENDCDNDNLSAVKKRKQNESNDCRVQINLDKTLIPKSNDKTIGLAFNGEKSELEALGKICRSNREKCG
ncbi:hypothetical protein BLA29_004361 [Euroglyphus maynei]|uniref:Uncharacterized protein n=1 Tax=Euroglyphus maynei TaxID=6958 RepID=A0A1Y3BPL4_EURMA|nr:hypothetical protein BLA29_004361 [Euroglyphus maynei]